MNSLKHFLAAACLLAAGRAGAQDVERCHINDVMIDKGTESLSVSFTIHPEKYRMGRNSLLRITPAITAPGDTARLTPLTVVGKYAWYQEIRNGGDDPLLFRASHGQPAEYTNTVPWQPWMDNSTFTLLVDTLSCCGGERQKPGELPVARLDWRPRMFEPEFEYVTPLDTLEKRFALSGRANVRFIVNKTDIDWSYANNHVELDSILRTVKVVRRNPDAAVDSILLTGYASPEGPYANNVRLARGRTEVIKEYVRNNGDFPASVYHTASVPEDWEGLRRWLADSNLPEREEMILFIDTDSGPVETKNDRFAAAFPSQYPWLLNNVYPPLRHTDYRITYTVRRYYEVEEIERVFVSYPGNLSLNELFVLANSYGRGTKKFDEVMSTAVLLYPNDPVANLNAANASMQIGDLERAERLLTKAGDSAQAEYARGVLRGRQHRYAEARQCFEKAARMGESHAADALRLLQELEKRTSVPVIFITQ
ncbi:MAG: hypothetical protein HDS13_02230 [Bacteroides sp.]|nr:hypothetical protein [Bacteroides sp.]